MRLQKAVIGKRLNSGGSRRRPRFPSWCIQSVLLCASFVLLHMSSLFLSQKAHIILTNLDEKRVVGAVVNSRLTRISSVKPSQAVKHKAELRRTGKKDKKTSARGSFQERWEGSGNVSPKVGAVQIKPFKADGKTVVQTNIKEDSKRKQREEGEKAGVTVIEKKSMKEKTNLQKREADLKKKETKAMQGKTHPTRNEMKPIAKEEMQAEKRITKPKASEVKLGSKTEKISDTSSSNFSLESIDKVVKGPKVRKLGLTISRKSMEDFSLLSGYQRKGRKGRKVLAPCAGAAECPNFGRCSEDQSVVAMCRNDDLRDNATVVDPPLNVPKKVKSHRDRMNAYEGNVFVLQNVYISPEGHIFNSSHVFIHGGCSSRADFNFSAETIVREFPALGFLVNPNSGTSYFHSMAEGLLDFVVMEGVLKKHPKLPMAIHPQQAFGHQSKLAPLVGLQMGDLNLIPIPAGELFFASNLVVPAGQHCGRPSTAVLRQLRLKFIKVPPLASSTLPLWKRVKKLPKWTIVVLNREEGAMRRLIGQEALVANLKKVYGSHRVKAFCGNLSMTENAALFKHAVLVIGTHGAELMNAYFMPFHSAMIEIRPTWDNMRFQSLAYSLKIDYYILRGSGTFESPVSISLNSVMKLVKRVLPPKKVS